MTAAQAHEFVARWNCILIPKKARTETETIRALNLYFGPVTAITFAACIFFLQRGSDVFHLAVALLFGLTATRKLWLWFRIKEVRRALEQSQIGNRKS
jgi:hypothetical protein